MLRCQVTSGREVPCIVYVFAAVSFVTTSEVNRQKGADNFCIDLRMEGSARSCSCVKELFTEEEVRLQKKYGGSVCIILYF